MATKKDKPATKTAKASKPAAKKGATAKTAAPKKAPAKKAPAKKPAAKAVKKPAADGAASDAHEKVQLWKDGPYWATTNIGAEKPEDFGYYFWWGDTVGYKREKDKWVATDGSSSDFSFKASNAPSYCADEEFLKDGGWIEDDGVLVPKHDAAHVHWGGDWRMPTREELENLVDYCDWTWENVNGVEGFVVRGRGAYTSASIFLPAAGYGSGTSLGLVPHISGPYGLYWSSVPNSDNNNYAWELFFYSDYNEMESDPRYSGQSIRPVQ